MMDNVACISYMKDVEGKGRQKDGQENICPAFSYSSIVYEQHDKNTQNNAAVNEYLDKLIEGHL